MDGDYTGTAGAYLVGAVLDASISDVVFRDLTEDSRIIHLVS